ncbi:DUF397 domain-containing protein [Streptomyces sp. SID9124]|nr:DUF397 domain-containing protein [Streptomyces sp. SID9124]NED14376.1 DUF397 domain-containing protein [Streptomyces sp. SID9124]
MSTEPIWRRSSYGGSGEDNCVAVALHFTAYASAARAF